jgi:DHA2 family methylenomycin A resistance protein-like MFS transporter
MAVIADVYAEPAAQARALGTWAAVSSLALPAGPLLGGLLVATVGWRPVFWINVPLVVLTVTATLAVVPDRQGRHGGRFDRAGLAALVVTLTGFVYTVIEAGHGAAPAVVGVAAGVTVCAAAAAVRAERRAERPILPLDLLRRPAFLSPNLVALTMNLVFNGLLFVTMLYLQDVRGLSALRAGSLVLPLAVPLVLLAPVSGAITARRGPRTAIALGCAVAAPGAALLCGLRPDGGVGWLLAGFTLLGCGAGLVTASVVAAAVRATPVGRSGLAMGVSNTARQVGTATGVALFGAVAGSPDHPGHFVSAVRALAAGAAVLWLLAGVVALRGVAGQPAE